MAELSVDKALLEAKSHARKGETKEAKKLYLAILQAFPENKRAQKGQTKRPCPRTGLGRGHGRPNPRMWAGLGRGGRKRQKGHID